MRRALERVSRLFTYRNLLISSKREILTSRGLLLAGKLLLDDARGLDFLTITEREDLGVTLPTRESAPSGGKYVANVLKTLNITSNDSIIDIGCGKGNAMRTMLKFPFQRVDGIELSEKVARIAERNFRLLKAKNTRIFNYNAATFERYGSYNIFYMYNPFPEEIMVPCMRNIVTSIGTRDAESIIIYNYPTCHQVIVDHGFVKIGEFEDEWRKGLFVYSNREAGRFTLHGHKRSTHPKPPAL